MQRTANAVWKGGLKDGSGTLDTPSGVLKGTPYSFKTRFEDESGKSGTNPEELIAAAHAGCFAMQLSAFLAENGTPADKLDAKAVVTLIPGAGITESVLTLVGTAVPCAGADVSAVGTGASVGPAVGGIAVAGSGVGVLIGTAVSPIGEMVGRPIAAVGDIWIG